MDQYNPGQVISLPDGRKAVIRFVGAANFAPGDWIGVELEEATGKNDGSVQGERYFTCAPGCGMFIRPTAVSEILERPAPSQPPPSTVSPRSSVVAAPRVRSSVISKTPAKPGATVTNGAARRVSSVRSSVAAPKASTNGPAASGLRRPSAPTATSTSATPSTAQTKTPAPAAAKSIKSPTRVSSTSTTTSSAVSHRRSLTSSTALGGARTSIPSTSTNGTAKPAPKPPPGSSRSTGPAKNPMLNRITRNNSISTVENRSRTGHATTASPRNSQDLTNTRSSVLNGSNALNKEIEDLKTTVSLLEKKRTEDKEKLRALEALHEEKGKYEEIIQKLQAKYQPQQQELADLRKRLKETQEKLEKTEEIQAEHEAVMEMATLDREMAEEMAEVVKTEGEALKVKVEEMELELDILREENQELGNGMSPEERSSTGWLQMERTNERLRDALLRLRDMTQQTEADLKAQIKEAEANLEDYSAIKKVYETTKEKLAVAESNTEHLKQQVDEGLDAAYMMEELTERNTHYQEQIADLRSTIEDLETLKELSDDLEVNHMETEKQFQDEIDYMESMYNEQKRRTSQQDDMISDLDYTVSKFRELVSTLQNDLEDMRVSQQISETEANDLSTRSRAMIDLNMKLQASISKVQTKSLDVELGRMEAEEATQHLNIMKLYIPEHYETERNPILAFLRFKRISFKSSLMASVVRERINDSSPLHYVLPTFQMLERLTYISSVCERFVNFISSCSDEVFSTFEGAWYELEPVERNLNHWIDGLRKGELNESNCALELHRSVALILHLSETLIPSTAQTKADDLSLRFVMGQVYLDNAASMLAYLKTMVEKLQANNKNSEDDAESKQEWLQLINKLDAPINQARTGKVIAGKIIRSLEDLTSRNLALQTESLQPAEEVESSSRHVAELSRNIASNVMEYLEDDDRGNPSPVAVATVMDKALAACSGPSAASGEDVTVYARNKIQALCTGLDNFLGTALDLTLTVEFERREPPWVSRSRELRSKTVMPSNAEEELRRYRNELHESATALGSKDRALEEQEMKIELLEARMRDFVKNSQLLQDLSTENESVKSREQELQNTVEKQSQDITSLEQEKDDYRARLEKSRHPSISTNGVSLNAGADGIVVPSPALVRENDQLRNEVANLQAAVRYLREESSRANSLDPYTTQQMNSTRAWLDGPLLRSPTKTGEQSRVEQVQSSECRDVFTHLLGMATSGSLYDLRKKGRSADSGVTELPRGTWRSVKTTARYQAIQHRESYESWTQWKDDVVRREQERYREQERNIERIRKAIHHNRNQQTHRRRIHFHQLISNPVLSFNAAGDGNDVTTVQPQDKFHVAEHIMSGTDSPNSKKHMSLSFSHVPPDPSRQADPASTQNTTATTTTTTTTVDDSSSDPFQQPQPQPQQDQSPTPPLQQPPLPRTRPRGQTRGQAMMSRAWQLLGSTNNSAPKPAPVAETEKNGLDQVTENEADGIHVVEP